MAAFPHSSLTSPWAPEVPQLLPLGPIATLSGSPCPSLPPCPGSPGGTHILSSWRRLLGTLCVYAWLWGVPPPPNRHGHLEDWRRPGLGLTVSPQVKVSYFGQQEGGALGHSVLYLTGAGE